MFVCMDCDNEGCPTCEHMETYQWECRLCGWMNDDKQLECGRCYHARYIH